jgi:hypothetical protein
MHSSTTVLVLIAGSLAAGSLAAGSLAAGSLAAGSLAVAGGPARAAVYPPPACQRVDLNARLEVPAQRCGRGAADYLRRPRARTTSSRSG